MNAKPAGARPLDRNAWADRINNEVSIEIEQCTDFASLVERLPSIYPTEILRSLDHLVAQQRVSSSRVHLIRKQAAQPRAPIDAPASLLPLPHPLDFEWRFTQRTAHELLHRLVDLTPVGGRALLFGTPGVAFGAMNVPIKRQFCFVGEDNEVSRRLRILNAGAGSPISVSSSLGVVGQVHAVLLDPPWYPDSVNPMLAAAAAVCRVHGTILISLPPPFTRASAERDQLDALRVARRLGLELIERQPLGVRYETPFFERNALRAEGIEAPMAWRRGDLLVFRKLRSTPVAIISPAPVRPWSEVSIGRMRLAIRHSSDPQLSGEQPISIVDGDVLPSVSRSDARRARAAIWTSGNRLFSSGDTQMVLEAALLARDHCFGTGYQPPLWCNLGQRDRLEAIAAQLAELATIEALEERGSAQPAMERASWKLDSNRSSVSSLGTSSGPPTLPPRRARPAA